MFLGKKCLYLIFVYRIVIQMINNKASISHWIKDYKTLWIPKSCTMYKIWAYNQGNINYIVIQQLQLDSCSFRTIYSSNSWLQLPPLVLAVGRSSRNSLRSHGWPPKRDLVVIKRFSSKVAMAVWSIGWCLGVHATVQMGHCGFVTFLVG